MLTPRTCAECGSPLPADDPGGACPVCAFRGALALSEASREVVLTEEPGDHIGRYKLLEKIGEGGCGVVYMADQAEPIRRRVALKIVKLGMDTKQVIARFEAERQALALMDHPNIAKVLDAGATDTGRPYFVMELVRGIRITDYCDQHNLSTGERLKLFMQVCHAVQHAHQKGIIHRDIKPSNILVTLLDGVPVPKVIDFGIAKATQQPLTDKTLFTSFRHFIGTPAYMSPEQAEMSGADVDTRSDIYSLGVLLYELLVGHTPFESRKLAQASLDEMRRLIREEEPTRPSTRLSALPREDLTTVAKCRRTEPPKLVHLVRGDLDWIVMKCLEKDRARRYDTANELARDVERHLSHEPVTAAAPNGLYRVAKFVRRHRFGVFMNAVAVSFVIAGVVAGLTQARRAEREKRKALQEADRATCAEHRLREALAKEKEARDEAVRERGRAEAAQKAAEADRDQAKRDQVEKGKALLDAEDQKAKAQLEQKVAQAAVEQAAIAEAAALAARDESLKQQAKVEDLIGFMLFDLSDKLRPLGRADLLRDVTERASAHFQLLTNADQDEGSLTRRFAAFKNLGYAFSAQGTNAIAESYYRKSLEIADQLQARATASGKWQAEQCDCHEKLGDILRRRGNSAGALVEFESDTFIL